MRNEVYDTRNQYCSLFIVLFTTSESMAGRPCFVLRIDVDKSSGTKFSSQRNVALKDYRQSILNFSKLYISLPYPASLTFISLFLAVKHRRVALRCFCRPLLLSTLYNSPSYSKIDLPQLPPTVDYREEPSDDHGAPDPDDADYEPRNKEALLEYVL